MVPAQVLLLALFVPGGDAPPADGRDEAHETYREKFARAAEGVHVQGQTLFVVVAIPGADSLAEELLESRALLRSAALVRQYAREAGWTRPGEGTALLEKHPAVLEECRKVVPHFGEPRLDFRVPSQLLEQGRKGGVWRYAVAIDRQALRRAIPEGAKESPSLVEVVACLKKRLTAAKRENARELPALWIRLGAVEEALRTANEALGRTYSLVSYAATTQDTVELCTECLAANRALFAGTATGNDLGRMLERLPGFPPALRRLADDYAEADRFAAAVNLRLLSLIDGENRPENIGKLLEVLRRWEQSAPSAAPALQQYGRLIEALSKTERSWVFADPAAEKASHRVWLTFGHVNFPPRSAEKRPLQEPAAGPWTTLKDGPDKADAWLAAGEAVTGPPLAAVPLLVQAVRLDPAGFASRSLLAKIYEKLGHDRLSQGLAWSALLALDEKELEKNPAAVEMCVKLLMGAGEPPVPKTDNSHEAE